MITSIVEILPEIIAFVVTLVSPIVPKKLLIVFVACAFLKVFYVLRNDIEDDIYSLAFIGAVSCVYDTSLLNRFLTGYYISISGLAKDFFCIVLGAVAGHLMLRLLNTNRLARARPGKVKFEVLGLVALSCGAIMLASVFYRLKGMSLSPRGDGSIDIWKVSVQLPEVLKIELVIAAYLTKQLMKHKRRHLITFYISAIMIVLTIAVAFKEFGSILQIIYFTLAISFYLTTASDVKQTVLSSETKRISFICSQKLPLIGASVFFGTLGLVKRVLYAKFIIRGADGELFYGLKDKWFMLSSRLSADSPQIEYARELFRKALMIQLNFNSTVKIPNAELSTALADYSYVVTAAVWGKLVSMVILTIFTAALGVAVFKRSGDMLARCAALMLLLQIFVHVSGILLHFCFTGVNLPFLSVGGSSLVSSVILSTFILESLRRDRK